MKFNTLRRWSAAILAALLLPGLFAPVLAAEGIDTERDCSLTVYFGADGVGFADVEFRLYRVADVSASGRFTLTGDFRDYPVTVSGLSSSQWRALAQTLAAYAVRDGLTPYRRAETGPNGAASFSGLPAGLYLVTGERHTADGRVYTPEPFLASLPTRDETGEWAYDVMASCKFDEDSSGGTVDRKVLKAWDDAGAASGRPESVTVQLLRDGKVYDTVVLSAENNWRFTWHDLDAGHSWQVVEANVPDGYTVSISREGITFVITNSRDGGGEPEPSPEPSTEPSPEPSTQPSPQPSTPPSPGNPNLPQTGVLWWPVPLLAVAGALLLLLGWGKRRRNER